MPSNTVLVSIPVVGASKTLIWSYSCVFLPPMSTAIRANVFFFFLWELSMAFYIFHRYRVCLVAHVDLICSLYNWWEDFESSSLAILPLSFNCGFISPSACGSSTRVCSWGYPGGLGSASLRARYGGDVAAWVAGFLAAPGTQGSWWLGLQEIKCSKRVWQPILANKLQYSCLENPTDRKIWQATVHMITKKVTAEATPHA